MTQAVAVIAELQRLSTLAAHWNWSSNAVIAREWKYLEPVRSYCELNHIPVQMADEEAPHFWRLRETQAVVEWVRAREITLVDTGAIGRWLDQQPNGPWWALLREAVEQYTMETGGAELPADHFTEWLAEWGREVRRRQTGLMLLTGHRAKGLEFDHVAVLDGGWDREGKNEDRDAPRRLYYVAMTRARKTLTLARLDGRHALLESLPESPCILHRAPTQLSAPAPELARHFSRLSLGDVDLGFAGRYAPANSVHRAIAELTAGDVLQLTQERERWELVDGTGRTVGRLARTFSPPAGLRCIAASVQAIIMRRREDSEPQFRDNIRCDRWEVVVPELVYLPGP
jgi:ATP-dependent DNA helicase RecQ